MSSGWKRNGLHTPLLFPFWGNPNQKSSLFAKEMFDTYSFDTSMYTVTDDTSDANVVLAPYRHNWLLRNDEELLAECARVAHKSGLPLLIDGIGDIEFPVRIENSFVLRIGGYKFIQEVGRIQVPPASDDLLERCVGGQMQLREKLEGMKPVIGFAGWTKLTKIQKLRTIIKELPTRIHGFFDVRYQAMQKGVLWRRRALDILKRSDTVELHLKERASFSGSAKTASTDMRSLRQEFVETVLQSDYALDVRGDANDSTRLFEILSLGRIPVVIDTERRLPFSGIVNYMDFCLIVDFRYINKLPNIVAEFHKKIAPKKFIEMQQNARDAFIHNFRIDAQMKHIIREIRLQLAA